MWIARHPLAAITEFPHLWFQLSRFACGLQEVTERDWEELSAHEFEQRLTLVSAANRKLRRDMKPKGSGETDGD